MPFRGRSDQTLLLHFWPLTVLIFVPQSIDRDGNAEFSGYTLAIPEIADLEAFCEDYPRMLADLDPRPRGYRPAAAVVDIPAQAGLEFLEHLARLTQTAVEKKRIYPSVSSIEYLHLVKVGNNTKVMAAGRVVPRPGLLDRYLRIVGDRNPVYRNPVFLCRPPDIAIERCSLVSAACEAAGRTALAMVRPRRKNAQGHALVRCGRRPLFSTVDPIPKGG